MTGSGGKFGKQDSTIENGMPVDECCRQIVKAMMLKREEMMIGPLTVQLMPYLMPFTPLVSRISDKLYKKQLSVKDKAK